MAQAFLELPSLGRAVGVELAPSRHKVALQAWASASASLRAAGRASTLVVVQSGAFGGLADESDASAESTSGELMLAERCAPVDGQAHMPEFVEASFLEVKHSQPVLVKACRGCLRVHALTVLGESRLRNKNGNQAL